MTGDALRFAGFVALFVAGIGLIFWLGARIAFVIVGGLVLLAAYLLGGLVNDALVGIL